MSVDSGEKASWGPEASGPCVTRFVSSAAAEAYSVSCDSSDHFHEASQSASIMDKGPILKSRTQVAKPSALRAQARR